MYRTYKAKLKQHNQRFSYVQFEGFLGRNEMSVYVHYDVITTENVYQSPGYNHSSELRSTLT